MLIEEEKEQLRLDCESLRKEWEQSLQETLQDNKDFLDQIDILNKDNLRLNEEKSDKDHLIKELTSKNLDLLARLSTVE
jgi:hypothetical protein